MRVRGLPLRDIAAKLCISIPSASKLIMRAIARLDRPGAEQVRAIELERLDVATRAVMPKVRRGLSTSIGALVRISERRAKLTGIDAPIESSTRVELRDGPTFPADPKEQIPILEAMLDEARRLVLEGT